MDTARQILRWAIPGWNIWLFAFLFIGVRFVLSGTILTLTDYATRNLDRVVTLLTVLAGLGIPIGFLIYQIYFWVYWGLPIPFKNPEDRGYTMLKDCTLPLQKWFGYEIDADAHKAPGKVFRLGPIRLMFKTRELLKRYQHNWVLTDSVWHQLLLLKDAKWLDDRALVLTDIYHSLGASLISLWLGFGIYLAYDVVMHRGLIAQGNIVYILAAIANLPILIALTDILRFNRTDTLRTLEAMKHDFITYCSRSEQSDEGDS
jgi:hypothetical protein